MSHFLSADVQERIVSVMFPNFNVGKKRENFLKNELVRYVPQMTDWTDEEISNFVGYQRSVYLDGMVPILGRPVASLNPTFVDNVSGLELARAGLDIYTRASVKENGYRLQSHVGVQDTSAFSRQFTPFDLRMFPELSATFAKLPVMVGDCELVNKRHPHLAGFHRLEKRMPDGAKYWPRRGSNKIDDELLAGYLANQELFGADGSPIEEFELTLVFHGLFAIAHPKTWDKSREEQLLGLLNLVHLPVDYFRMDSLLDDLEVYLQENELNARVVERKVIDNRVQLLEYIEEKEEKKLEGVCVVQTARNSETGRRTTIGRSIKVKRYETLDTALMGLYLEDKSLGLVEDNVTGALCGLWDKSLGRYLSALKVNLDITGPQVKTRGQRERLIVLRHNLVETLNGRKEGEEKILTLYDVFLEQGKITLKYLLGETQVDIEGMIAEIPRGHKLLELLKEYEQDKGRFVETMKKPKVGEKFILKFKPIFDLIGSIEPGLKEKFFAYLAMASEVKTVSAKLVKPQYVADLSQPIILETRAFDVKWGLCPYPAGFHTYYGDSFAFNNAYAERIRNDKNTTTDYETVFVLTRRNTVKKRRIKK